MTKEDRLELYKWVGRNAGKEPIADKVLGLLHELDRQEESIREALMCPMEDKTFITTESGKEVLAAMDRMVGLHLSAIGERDAAAKHAEILADQNKSALEAVERFFSENAELRSDNDMMRKEILWMRQLIRDGSDLFNAIFGSIAVGEPSWTTVQYAYRTWCAFVVSMPNTRVVAPETFEVEIDA